jgi:MarR family 2-MHQ and catechol resistance regulon transcriptional repressor
MPQFVVGNDGLISEAAAAEQAEWYVTRCAEVDSVDFEAHIMLVRAYAALKIGAPFDRRGGLSKPRFNVLRMLYASDEQRLLMSEIVHGMNVSPTSISKLVDGLEESDYVRRVGNMRDKRTIWVELMPKGREAVEDAFPDVGRYVGTVWSGLSHQEKKVLIHLLSKLRFGILSDAADEHVEWIARHPVVMPVFS